MNACVRVRTCAHARVCTCTCLCTHMYQHSLTCKSSLILSCKLTGCGFACLTSFPETTVSKISFSLYSSITWEDVCVRTCLLTPRAIISRTPRAEGTSDRLLCCKQIFLKTTPAFQVPALMHKHAEFTSGHPWHTFMATPASLPVATATLNPRALAARARSTMTGMGGECRRPSFLNNSVSSWMTCCFSSSDSVLPCNSAPRTSGSGSHGSPIFLFFW